MTNACELCQNDANRRISNLKKEKFQLRKTELSFMGVKKIGFNQCLLQQTKMKSDARLLGVVTYLSQFSEDLSTKTESQRTMLKKETAFIWEANEQKAFEEIKTLISYVPLLKYFNPVETVEIQVDASSSGLGACLMHGNQPIKCASRALTETEKRYSQIEKEMLSIV